MRESRFLGFVPHVLAMVLLATGCGGGESDSGGATDRVETVRPDPNPRPEDAQILESSTGRHGGRYVSTVRQDPKTWNVLMANESSTTTFTSGILYESLVDWDYITQERGPGLAKSWEVDTSGTVWIFHLRQGIRWSDGQPITTDDLMFTAEIVYDDEVHPSVAELAKVDGEPFKFEKIDAHTLRVTTKKPMANFLNVIGSIYPMPKHILEESYRNGTFASAYGVDSDPASLVTSGPWTLARHVPQEKVVLRPNPHYYEFDAEGKRLPYLDELVYLVVPDQNAELLKFQSGESDEIYFRAEDFADMKDGEASGDYTVYDLGAEMGTNFIWFNLNRRKNPNTGKPYVDPVKLSWFSDRNFRIAVSHGIDRASMVRNIYYGLAEPLYGSIPPVNKKWHNPDIDKYTYDVEKARRILEGAGYRDTNGDGIREDQAGNKVSFVLLVPSDNKEREGMANIIKNDMTKIGLECVLAPSEFNTLISKLRATYDYDCMMLGLTGGVPPHPSQSQNVFQSSGKTHFWSPEQETPATEWEAEIDRLMTEQITMIDEAELKRSFDRVQKILSERQPVIYNVSRRGLIAIRNKFVGLRPSVLRPWVLHSSTTISHDPARAKRELAERR